MDHADIVQKAIERLLRPSDGRLEIVVIYRREDDYIAYEQELNALREKVKRQEQDIYTWSLMGNKYMAALDELRRLEAILRKHKIPY